MASPDPPYLTQQWSGITHYICSACGYNSFQTDALDRHQCAPREETEAVVTVDVSPDAPPVPAAQTPLPEKES